MLNAHTGGCPVYVLEPRLTSAGGKIPKWRPRSRRAQYVGVSPVHAENVALVRNLRTGYLSPQFHVVFDDQFETIYADADEPPRTWEDLCIYDKFEATFDKDPPQLGPEWHDPEEQVQKHSRAPSQGRKLYHELQSKDRDIKDDFAFDPPKRLPVPREQQLSAPREPPDLKDLTQVSERPQFRPTREKSAPSSWVRKPHVQRIKSESRSPL